MRSRETLENDIFSRFFCCLGDMMKVLQDGYISGIVNLRRTHVCAFGD